MRPTRSRAWFTRFAKWTAKAAGRPLAFTLAVTVIALWVITGPLFGFSDTWQLIINTGTTIITFLMVFLIQSTQNRDSEAIQVKLDELIRLSQGGHNALLDLEELEEEELDAIREEYCRIAEEARARLRRGEHDTDVPEVSRQIAAVKHDVEQERRELALKKRL
ncbi:MAG TPA: low affinity iron permease family protein [Burkholderiales bacterium]|nr:low affinity iron permease family protein [Burkholderiales bacterium]